MAEGRRGWRAYRGAGAEDRHRRADAGDVAVEQCNSQLAVEEAVEVVAVTAEVVVAAVAGAVWVAQGCPVDWPTGAIREGAAP